MPAAGKGGSVDGRDRSSLYGGLVGAHPKMLAIAELLRRLEGAQPSAVLVTGETGTGKDVVARSLHEQGPRREGPFVVVDCASVPELLLEAELFGHERGAFTDAREARSGLLEAANGGTLFLDEIGELPLRTQPKLLRALESRTFRRVGGVRAIPWDAALVVATHRDLSAEVCAGRFRGDLFYRLDVVRVHVPPLRDRLSDVPLLVRYLMSEYSRREEVAVPAIDDDAMDVLGRYTWPGNVRELRNLIEWLVLVGPRDEVRPRDLPPHVRFSGPAPDARRMRIELPEAGVPLVEVERGLVQQAIERSGGNRTHAAQLLGLSRFALRSRLKKFGIA
jgi:two-component system response regulator HydG